MKDWGHVPTRLESSAARHRDDLPSVTHIKRRLYTHLAQLRGQRTESNPGTPSDGDEDIRVWKLCLPRSDKIRIYRRTRAVHDRAEAATGLAHLSSKTRARLSVLREGFWPAPRKVVFPEVGFWAGWRTRNGTGETQAGGDRREGSVGRRAGIAGSIGGRSGAVDRG